MEKNELLRRVAPCSLMCYTCPGCQNGAISRVAAQLCTYFEGYYDFNDANLPQQYRGWLDEFKAFEERLKRFTNAKCPTCRQAPEKFGGCIAGCVVRECYTQKGVDFCAECDEFPCEKAISFFAGINAVIRTDWEAGNRRIQEIGIEQYYDEKKDISHYLSFKK